MSLLTEGASEATSECPSEEWRQSLVDGLLVSSLGRVMILPSVKEMPKGGSRHYPTKPTFGVVGDNGRLQITVRGRSYRIHQLVCSAFHGAKPFRHAVVMHLDEDQANNRAGNLAWGTQKENLNAPGFIAYCKARTGEDSPVVKGRK